MRPIPVEDPHDRRKKMLVPCGRCAACLSNKANDWVTRLRAETQAATSAFFITLTYEDHFLPRDKKGQPCFSLTDMQRLLKRLRSVVPDKLRYYYVCEYGTNFGRPHYHMILWNWPPEVDLMTALGKHWVDSKGRMMSIWLPEMVKPLCMEHILYVSKYTFKKAEVPSGRMKPYMRCSKGIGKALLSPETVEFYRSAPSQSVFIDGQQYFMPRYYKDKIYNDPELKKALLLSKIRYVNAQFDKQRLKDMRLLHVAEYRSVQLRTRVDKETGEIVNDIIEKRPEPLGLLQRAGILSDREFERRKRFEFKNQAKVKKSYLI